MGRIIQSDANGARYFEAKSDNNETVGFAVSSIDSNGKLSLDSIHVIPGIRKNGVGSILLDAVISWGISEGANELVGEFFPEFRGGKDEEDARKFYAKNGINIDGENNLRGRIR